MPAIIVDTPSFDFTHTAHTATQSLYHYSSSAQTGWPNQPVASPVGRADALFHFCVPNVELNYSISHNPYVLNEAEDQALWDALRESTTLVSKGRLVE